jgi:S1-C subfamily serine protease
MLRRLDAASHRARIAERLATLILLGCVPCASGASDLPTPSTSLDTELARQTERALQGKLGGRGLRPVRRETGTLRVGESRSFELELRRGEDLLVVGACDAGCRDLDLALVDAEGVRQVVDERLDAFPFVGGSVARDGRGAVSATMAACDGSCRFGVQILASHPAVDLEEDLPARGGRQREGTCFAVHPGGLVATAAHVVEGAEALRVHLADGKALEAKVLSIDPESDLALLRLPEPTPDLLPLAPADSVALGERVFTLGYPVRELLGDEPKFTDGVITALSGHAERRDRFQITVPIQPGSSGGPLVTEQGFAVGVVTESANVDFFRALTGRVPQNVNFAVRSDALVRLLPSPAGRRPAVDRPQAIERARASLCWVEELADPEAHSRPRYGARGGSDPERARGVVPEDAPLALLGDRLLLEALHPPGPGAVGVRVVGVEDEVLVADELDRGR